MSGRSSRQLQAHKCLVMAHRGASDVAPANTLPAFAAAIAAGADVIETDVHWTADDVLVIAHDPAVDAVSDGEGRIADFTLSELRHLDFGYRFSPDGGLTFPYRGKGVTIPTFRELLERWPNARINVDLKPKRAQVASFLKILDDARALHRVVLASFHHQTLVEARLRCPQLATSASTREVVAFLASGALCRSRLYRQKRPPYLALQVPYETYHRRVVTASFVHRAHRMGVEVHVWTVDDVNEMKRLIHLCVDGIVTNSPSALRKILLDSHA